MGLMIVAGLVVIAVTLFNRLQQAASPEPPPAAVATVAPAQLPSIGEHRVPLGTGCRIQDMQTAGERLLVRTGGGGVACDRIFIFDLGSGRVLGQVLGQPLGDAPPEVAP